MILLIVKSNTVVKVLKRVQYYLYYIKDVNLIESINYINILLVSP